MADLHVSKKSIGKLFSDMQNKQFIIPEYQRPYKWDEEKCETLWNDIVDFSATDAKGSSDYFLGTIVTFVNEGSNPEIIDGQQRITSFLLLLRAFYRKLEDMIEDEDVIGLKNQLAPCIWDINPISQKVTDKTKIHINSQVVTDNENAIFHEILETGYANASFKDNYSVNYRFFKKMCDEYAENNPMQWKQLCVNILQRCVILPIDCDASETALTIFSTLNDRGLPLADSDIFKARIYRNSEGDEKRKEFTLLWKELTNICKRANITVDDIFRYYSHVLRAKNNDRTKEVGLRKFYSEENYKKLHADDLISNLMSLAQFWECVNALIEPEDDVIYKIPMEARKYLHCLSWYPNEFWKYATSVFFIKNINSETFEHDFVLMLKKLTAFLFAKFIEAPTVNAIKDDIYGCCISLYNNNELQFKYSLNEELLKQQIEAHSTSRLSRAILLLNAYLNVKQDALIPRTFDIEHIFPQKWQNTNYNGWNKEDADIFLERFGNKIVFERKLNIQAGNGYFGVKKNKYKTSCIACVLELSNYDKDDWIKDDILKREEEIKSSIISFLAEQLH